MKINTKKIQREMKSQGLTLEELGKRFNPPHTRQAAWGAIHNAKTLRVVNEIARVLDMDPKDLLK